MGIISIIADPQLRARLYDEGAAIPYRGMSVLDDVPWDDNGLHFMTIVTDQTPAGPAGRGHYDAVIDGGRIKFKKERDV
jgi:hypothetical protein